MDTVTTKTAVAQVSGNHYHNESGYAHWDWVLDIGMGYLLGCSSKYLMRWREKNGLVDLEKAQSYLQKHVDWLSFRRMGAHKPQLQSIAQHQYCLENTHKLIQLHKVPEPEAAVIYQLTDGNDLRRLGTAKAKLAMLIEMESLR